MIFDENICLLASMFQSVCIAMPHRIVVLSALTSGIICLCSYQLFLHGALTLAVYVGVCISQLCHIHFLYLVGHITLHPGTRWSIVSKYWSHIRHLWSTSFLMFFFDNFWWIGLWFYSHDESFCLNFQTRIM